MGMSRRNGESITANKVRSEHTKITETNQRPAFFVHCKYQHTCTHMPKHTLARVLRTKVARMEGKHACTYTCWSMHAILWARMYAHVGGLAKRVNVLSKQDELFLQTCTRNREGHARGDCLLTTQGSVMPDGSC